MAIQRIVDLEMSGAQVIYPFHLAFPVDDLSAARAFYGGVLGCTEGRSSTGWIDFNLYGHQIVAHLSRRRESTSLEDHSDVDGHHVPVRHFGVVLPLAEWESLVTRLRAAEAPFIIEPTIRFTGEVGEQRTLFVRDPAGNALEFKSMTHPGSLFAQ